MKPINVSEYEALAQKLIEPSTWDYFQGGSDDEVTLRANRTAFERIRLRPRMLVDISSIDMCTTVLGTPIDMPIMVAPSAYHELAHPEAECATVKAAGMAHTLMVASTFSSRSLEEIARAASGPLWLQLYIYDDLHISEGLVRRAELAGYKAIALTADTPRLGNRERDIRNHFALPRHMRVGNFANEETPENHIPLPLAATWKTFEWLRSITSLPILLKGILTAEDAHLALEHGAQGIIVSNHGGRQLDGVMASIEALPEVVDAVNGRCEVYLDGGIRRGTDVLKALALGARAVLTARPLLWGIVVNGHEGAYHVLELLREELELSMILSGQPNLASINRSLVKIL